MKNASHGTMDMEHSHDMYVLFRYATIHHESSKHNIAKCICHEELIHLIMSNDSNMVNDKIVFDPTILLLCIPHEINVATATFLQISII